MSAIHRLAFLLVSATVNARSDVNVSTPVRRVGTFHSRHFAVEGLALFTHVILQSSKHGSTDDSQYGVHVANLKPPRE
jgi:hypothetical protein